MYKDRPGRCSKAHQGEHIICQARSWQDPGQDWWTTDEVSVPDSTPWEALCNGGWLCLICRSKKGQTVPRGDNAEDILAMLSSGDNVHKVPLTLEGGVARVMKKLLDQVRSMRTKPPHIPCGKLSCLLVLQNLWEYLAQQYSPVGHQRTRRLLHPHCPRCVLCECA